MPSATMEFQVHDPWEEDLDPETEFECYELRMAELLLPEWKNRLDTVFDEAKAVADQSREELQDLCEANLNEFRERLYARNEQSIVTGVNDPETTELVSFLTGQPPEFFEKVLADLNEQAVNFTSWDPELNPHCRETLVMYAGQALEKMEFADVTERLDFARVAAKEALDELAPSRKAPAPPGCRSGVGPKTP